MFGTRIMMGGVDQKYFIVFDQYPRKGFKRAYISLFPLKGVSNTAVVHEFRYTAMDGE